MTVADLLSDSSKWCQHAAALDASGAATDPSYPSAVQWCLVGAVEKIYSHERYAILTRLSDYLLAYTRLSSQIIAWNDSDKRTFEDVRHVIKALDI